MPERDLKDNLKLDRETLAPNNAALVTLIADVQRSTTAILQAPRKHANCWALRPTV